MKSTLSYLLIICSLFTACIGHQEESLLFYVDTRTGTAPSATHTAELFGKNTEEYGQTLPAVLEPNGMNFWTPQTQDTEAKCKAPYYYKDNKTRSHTDNFGENNVKCLIAKGICRFVPHSSAGGF